MAMTKKQQALEGFIPVAGESNRRAPTPTIQQQEIIRPVASPTGAWEQPNVVKPVVDTSMQDLAKALAGFEPELNRFAVFQGQEARALAKQQEEADKQAAQEAWVKSSQAPYAEAVKNGAIPPQASPFFQKKYKELEGDGLGRTLAADLEQEYVKSGLSSNPDTKAFDAWYAGQVQTRLKDVSDPFVLKGVLPHVAKLQDTLTNRHVKEAGDEVYKSSLDNVGLSISYAVDEEVKRAGEGATPDINGLARTVEALSGQLKSVGARGADLNKVVVDTIVGKARELNDPGLLDILKKPRSNGTPGAGETVYGRDQIQKAEESILHNMEREDDRMFRLEERERKKASRVVLDTELAAAAQNPGAPASPEAIRRIAAVDPEAVDKYLRSVEHLNSNRGKDDPVDIIQVERLMEEADRKGVPVLDVVMDAQAAGLIKNPATFSAYRTQARTLDASRDSAIFKVEGYKEMATKIREMADPMKLNPDAAAQAGFTFRKSLAEWQQENPKASLLDRMNALEKIYSNTVKGLEANPQEVKPHVASPVPPQASPKPTSSSTPQQAVQPQQRPQEAVQLPDEPVKPANVAGTDWLRQRITELSAQSVNVQAPVREGGPSITDLHAAVKRAGSTSPIGLAAAYLGKREGSDTEALSAFFKKACGISIDPGKTAWCAAFANSVLASTGAPTSKAPLLARSFLEYGDKVDKPTAGDVVVFSRGSDQNKGHVGFYVGEDEKGNIMVLGGNQSNSVSIQSYSKDKLLGIRRPPTFGGK